MRGAILERAAAGYIAPGDYPMSILVMGGSQGARILSDMCAASDRSLADRDAAQHPCEPSGPRRRLDACGDILCERTASTPTSSRSFTDVPNRMTEAQLVISRAGASSVADMSVIGRPSILVPFPAAAGDHQTANARGLADAGAAILDPESQLEVGTLAEQIATIM